VLHDSRVTLLYRVRLPDAARRLRTLQDLTPGA
jgi:hypothetical protein